MAKTLVE